MELFEKVDSLQYTAALFFAVNGIPTTGDEIESESRVDGVVIKKLLTSGVGLNVLKEEEMLKHCRDTKIFTREIELAYLSGDTEMFLYEGVGDAPCVVNALDIVGRYVFIGDGIVCSPVRIDERSPYANRLFPVLRDYVIDHHSEADGYIFDYTDGRFSIVCDGKEYLSISGAGEEITYAFVLYVLKRLASRSEDFGYESGFKISRIRLKE